jgi:HD-like signal output (HDOD) protein
MDKQRIFKKIADQLALGELVFPTGAQLALKVSQALDHPDCSVSTAARLISAEPLLAARVIAIANSVVYNRSGREIDDVSMAVSRLGFSTVRSLAMALVTRQMAGASSDPKHRALVDQLWQHTAHVASLAQVIARHVTHQNPESAMFAGIIHEIGGFYMLSRAAEFPGLLDGDFTEWLEFSEIEVGRAVLQKLSVPITITAAIESYWEGFLAMPAVDLGDTLLLAEELSPVASPLHWIAEAADIKDARIEMVIDDETLDLILKEAGEEINSLTRALQF